MGGCLWVDFGLVGKNFIFAEQTVASENGPKPWPQTSPNEWGTNVPPGIWDVSITSKI